MPRASLSKVRCPSCGGSDIRPSQRRGFIDMFMTMFRRSPFRCRSCRRRFHFTDNPREQEQGAVEEVEEEA